MKRVSWTDGQRQRLVEVMVAIISNASYDRYNFPFNKVVTEAQNDLKYAAQGLARTYFSPKEITAFREAVQTIIVDRNTLRVDKLQEKFQRAPSPVAKVDHRKPGPVTIIRPALPTPSTLESKEGPIDVPPVASAPIVQAAPVPPAVIEQLTVELNPMQVLNDFIGSASKLVELVIDERAARQKLELRVATQERLLLQQAEQLQLLHSSFNTLEDFITTPTAKVEVPKAEARNDIGLLVADSRSPVSETLLLAQPVVPISYKRRRVHILGMSERNHAAIRQKFDHDFNLHFHEGNKKDNVNYLIDATDRIYIMSGFCNHCMSDNFTDAYKRGNLKTCVKVINGGQTALHIELTTLKNSDMVA